MKINKGARHYRRFEWWFNNLKSYKRADKFGWTETNMHGHSKDVDNYNISLCSYFWAAFVKYWLVRYGPKVGVALLGLLFTGWVTLALVLVIQNIGFVGFAIILGIVLAGVMVAGGIAWLFDRRDSRRGMPASPTMQYIKARKAKVCPIIEFEE